MGFLARAQGLWEWGTRVPTEHIVRHNLVLLGHILGGLRLRRPPADLGDLRGRPVRWFDPGGEGQQVGLLLLLLLRPQRRLLVLQHHISLLRGHRRVDPRLLGGHGLGRGRAHRVPFRLQRVQVREAVRESHTTCGSGVCGCRQEMESSSQGRREVVWGGRDTVCHQRKQEDHAYRWIQVREREREFTKTLLF